MTDSTLSCKLLCKTGINLFSSDLHQSESCHIYDLGMDGILF